MIRSVLVALLLAVTTTACSTMSTSPPRNETVIVLHGLGRTPRSMTRMAGNLTKAGYTVHNVGYPSQKKTIEKLVEEHLRPVADAVSTNQPLHFVGHSLGGILARCYIAQNRPPQLGRLVMLGPPNQGSELPDTLGKIPLVSRTLGPASAQLSTAPDSLPNVLPPPDYEVGIIAGDFSWNPFFSAFIEGPDDGKVSVERAKLDGMTDFVVVPYSHTWLMWRRPILQRTRHFLEHGRFE